MDPVPATRHPHGHADAHAAVAAAWSPEDVEVRMDPLPDRSWLELQWRELESRSACSFFLSWSWINQWLALIGQQYPLSLITVHHRRRLVGMGLVTARRRFLGLGPLHLRLHEVGDREIDNLTIEYNGLLTEAGKERLCLTAMIDHLARQDSRWSTLFLPGVEEPVIDWDAPALADLERRISRQVTRQVDLDAIREGGKPYLEQLSPNNRSAIRRTERKIAREYGDLQFSVAQDPDQRVAWFREMAALHQAHWTTHRRTAGAFGDQRIRKFHESLMGAHDPQQQIQLTRLSAGDRTIGYAYNFIHRGTAYFYQSGTDYRHFASFGSPGLLLLSRNIEHAVTQGLSTFDFLAGDSRYKRALADAEGELLWVSLDRAGLTSRARRLWHRLRPPPSQ